MTIHHGVQINDERDAFQLHESGLSWGQIAQEIGCTEGTAQAFAAAYQQRTDAASAQLQIALF